MKRCVVLATAGVFTAMVAAGSEFISVGSRALSAGGAGVGGTSGAYATYYNPAGLAGTDGISDRISLSANIFVRDYELADYIDRLSNYDWNDITRNPLGNASDAFAVADILREIPDGGGVLVGGAGAVLAQAGPFGFGIVMRPQLALIPEVDKDRLNISGPWDPNSIAYNRSAIRIRALSATEIPVAYAYPIETAAGQLVLGGALKIISGETYNGSIVVTDADSDTINDEIEAFSKKSTGLGVDGGVQFHFAAAPVSVGVLARNINSPGFDTVTGESFEDAMQIRAGAEWELVPDLFSLVGDVDVMRNETLLPEYESQMIGFGGRLEGFPSIFALSLRAGVMQNIAESQDGPIFTGGVGFGFKYVHVELAAAVSSKSTTIDGTDYPREAQLGLSVVSSW